MGKNIINGIGPDADIITNEQGGKQSKSPMALYLVDADFLSDYIEQVHGYSSALDYITEFMVRGDKTNLIQAIISLSEKTSTNGLIEIAKVLEYGAKRYEVNNWRLISQEDHINHALVHLYAFIIGDEQDDHVGHCMCRLMMAYSTECSEGFNYTKYIKTEK